MNGPFPGKAAGCQGAPSGRALVKEGVVMCPRHLVYRICGHDVRNARNPQSKTIRRYFQQPTEVKAAFPTTDWSTLDLLGYKAYRMQEGGQTIWPT